MDNVTHTLFALTLARTRLGRAGRGVTAALIVASNAPDIDFASALGGTAQYLRWHRGPTHGPLGVVGLGLLTAGIVWGVERFQSTRNQRTAERAPAAPFQSLLVAATLGVLFHVLMDLPTSYGTRLLSPFDWRWFGADWLPIVDVYLLIVLGAGLVFGRMTPAARRHNVAIAFTLMAANYALRGAAHSRAIALAPRAFGPTLPKTCDGGPLSHAVIDSWPRPAPGTPAQGRCLLEIAAMPTFLSPFHWRVMARLPNAYEIHEVDIIDARFLPPASTPDGLWRTTVRYPYQWTPAVARSATGPMTQIFLGFSRFPDPRVLDNPSGVSTVRWTDMRFVDTPWPLARAGGRTSPFTVTVHVDADQRIVDERIDR